MNLLRKFKNFKGKNILLTGASGFIGYNLSKILLELETNVYSLVKEKGSFENEWRKRKLRKYLHYNEIPLKNFNLKNYEKYIPKLNFDACYNLAAYGVDYEKEDIQELIEGNVILTTDLYLYCCKKSMDKFIHIGSCYEYESTKTIITEKTNINPFSLYGAAKAATYFFIRILNQKNPLKITVLRLFCVYGEGEGMHKLIPYLCKSAIINNSIELTSGYQKKDYLYIKDVLEAALIAGTFSLPGVFNICSGKLVSVRKLATLLFTINQLDLNLLKFGKIKQRQNEPFKFIGSYKNFYNHTGWLPKYSLEIGLKNTFEWYKDNWEIFNERS